MAKRTVHEIKESIAKLQTELREVELEERKLTSAVHILHNLGWSFNMKTGGWDKPKVSTRPDPFDPKVHNPFREGDWVQHKVFGDYYRVYRVEEDKVLVQKFAKRVGYSMFTSIDKVWYKASQFRSVVSSQVR